MKKIIALEALGILMIAITSCSKPDVTSNAGVNSIETGAKRTPQPTSTTYSGQSIGLNATIISIQDGTVISNQELVTNTGILPAVGGNLMASDVSANVQNVVTTGSLNASVSGSDNQTHASSTVTGFNFTSNGYVISAEQVSASATALCGSTNGNSQITNLVINGQPVTVTGAPNQMIFFPSGGYIMINGQSVSKGKNKNITVTGLRIVIPNTAEVNIATARAEIKC